MIQAILLPKMNLSLEVKREKAFMEIWSGGMTRLPSRLDLTNGATNMFTSLDLHELTEWAETHHEIVTAINFVLDTIDKSTLNHSKNVLIQKRNRDGMGGIYEIGIEATNEFYEKSP